jgi:Na+-driven multidrug efflux pump
MKYTLMFSTAAGALMLLFPGAIMGALTNSRELIGIGSAFLIVMGLSQIPQNMTGLYNGALRGAGYVNMSLVIITVGIWLVRIPGIFIAAFIFTSDLTWIWVLMGMDLLVRYILAYLNFRKKDIFGNGQILNEQVMDL